MNCIHKQVEILEISGKFGKDFQTIFVQKTKQNKKPISEFQKTHCFNLFHRSIQYVYDFRLMSWVSLSWKKRSCVFQ